MKRIILFLLLFLSSWLPSSLLAQAPLEAGIFIGATNYLGDLAEQVSIQETQVTYGVFTRWVPIKYIGIKTSLIAGVLSGDDRNSPFLNRRGFSFSDPFWSANLQLELIPFAKRTYISFTQFKPGFQPFAHAGIGYTFINAKVDASESPDEAFKVPIPEPEDKSTFLNTSFGLGIRLDLWEYWTISVDGTWWYVFSDYLDGISINGRPDRNDWYLSAGVSISHHFGGRTICPQFR